MITDRRIALLLTSMALLMSTGCEAIATIFETGVWVGVILVVVVLGAVAFVVGKFRGGSGPPRGTIAAAGGVLLMGTALTADPRPDEQTPSAPKVAPTLAGDQQQRSAPAHEEILLQGCVARDDGWRPEQRTGVAGAAASPAENRGEMFVLRDARRMGADAASAERTETRGDIYRLLPRSGVSLSTFEDQQVEVRGRLREADDDTTAPPVVDHRNSQAVQGGQMQAVGQTMSPGQGGQSGQSTATPPESKTRADAEADTDADSADSHPTFIVTSVRMLAPTCARVQ